MHKVIVCFTANDMTSAMRLQGALQGFVSDTANGPTPSVTRELITACRESHASILNTSIINDSDRTKSQRPREVRK